MSTSFTLTPNRASFDRFHFALSEFRLAAGISMRDGFIREAGYCCYEFMRYSPPMPKGGGQGLSGAAKKAGESAVNYDIQSIFRPKDDPGSRFQMMGEAALRNDLGTFTRLQKSGAASYSMNKHGWYTSNESRAPRGIYEAILLGQNPQRDFEQFKNRFNKSFQTKRAPKETTDLAGVHRQIKSQYNGRIIKHNGPGLAGIKYLVDAAKLKTYIELKKKAVGYLKAGWANTLQSLPTPAKTEGVQFASQSKVPKWITRNRGSNGYSRFSGSKTNGNFTMLIGNAVGDNEGMATSAKTIQHVLNVRANKLDREVMRRLGKYIKLFNAQN